MTKAKSASAGPRTAREETIEALVSGRLRFHELPDDLPGEEAAGIRREALARITGASLEAIGHHSFDASIASKRNCENLIGVAQIPMGVVGPLTVHGDHVDGDVFVPREPSSHRSTAAAPPSASRAAPGSTSTTSG